MHEKEPGVYHLAIPVMDYFRDLDILLAAIERGINEDGITRLLSAARRIYGICGLPAKSEKHPRSHPQEIVRRSNSGI